MANARLGNVIHIDSTGVVSTDRNTRVIGILFTTATAGDAVVLRESASGGDKLSLKHSIDEDTKYLRMDGNPIIFGSGIYVQSISAGAKLMLIVSQSNGE
jgi:hypothetical protein